MWMDDLFDISGNPIVRPRTPESDRVWRELTQLAQDLSKVKEKPMADPVIFEARLFLCQQCYKLSGYGQNIAIRYSNTGGYNPTWEGRLCSHLQPADVLAYLKR